MSLLNKKSFEAHFAAITRKAGFEVENHNRLKLNVIVHGQSMRVDLKQIYQIYKKMPDRLDDLEQAHLNALGQVPQLSPAPTEKEAAESLLPMLQHKQWIKGIEKRDIPVPVHQHFIPDVVIAYVFDFPDRRAYVNKTMVPEFVDQIDEFHQYALENLRKRTTSKDYETHGLGDTTIIACETDDGFAATRILLPDLMETWAKRIPGRMLLGIPNRDFLIAFSDRDPNHVATMAQQIRRDTKKREYPLSGNLLLWENGRVREYQPKH